MSTLDIIKRVILEGKLDTELGITDGDVVKRFDIVTKLLDKLLTLAKFEPYKDLTPFDWSKSNVNPNPFDWRNKVWSSSNPIVMGKVEEPTDG